MEQVWILRTEKLEDGDERFNTKDGMDWNSKRKSESHED